MVNKLTKRNQEFITTGFRNLDALLKGFSRGSIIDIYGEEGCGKTLMALDLMKHITDQDYVGCYIDTNFNVDLLRIEEVGINQERFFIAQPENGDMAVDIITEVLKDGICDVIVVDSVSGFFPKINSLKEEGHYKAFMNEAINKIDALAKKHGSIVIFLNEFRNDAEGNKFTLGTDYLTLIASLRAELSIINDGIFLDIKKNKINNASGMVQLYRC